eukprot:s2323_g7.t1
MTAAVDVGTKVSIQLVRNYFFGYVRIKESNVRFLNFDVSRAKPSLPQVHLLLIGYPCKSISAQNNQAKSFLDESSSSGGGFASLMKFVDACQPTLVVAENVKNMESKRAKFGGEIPIEIQNKAFERRNYQAFYKTVNSTSFGLRQRLPKVVNPLDLVSMFQCKLYPLEMFLNIRDDGYGPACAPKGMKKPVEKPAGKKPSLKWHAAFEKAEVYDNLDKIRMYNMPLTDRELAIVATAVTELQSRGFNPYGQMLFVQFSAPVCAAFLIGAVDAEVNQLFAVDIGAAAARSVAAGSETPLLITTVDALPKVQKDCLSILDSIYGLRHCQESEVHSEPRGLLTPESNGLFSYPIGWGGTFKDIAQRAWSDPDQLLQLSAQLAFDAGFLDEASGDEFLQQFCKLDGETVTVRLPSQPLKSRNIAWGNLYFHDGSQKTLAAFAVWLSLIIAAQIPDNQDHLKSPQMQALIGSLLRMRTVVKSSIGVSDDVDSMVSRIVKQNSDSKIQPVSALAWCSILRSMGDAVTFEALMQKYNAHPEVAAYELEGGAGSIALDNKKRQAGGLSCFLLEGCSQSL